MTKPQATKSVKQQPILCPANSFSSTAKVYDLATDGRESHSKEKPDKLSSINTTRCRHNHKTRYELNDIYQPLRSSRIWHMVNFLSNELNVSKNNLFTDSVNIHTHTFKQIYFLLSKLYFPKGHLRIMYFICFHILLYAY